MSLTSNKTELTIDINIGTDRPAGKSESYGFPPSATFDDTTISKALTLVKCRQNTLPGDCNIVSARLKIQTIQRFEWELLPSPLAGKFNNTLIEFAVGDKISYTAPAGVLTFQASDMLLVDNPDNAWFFRAQSKTGNRRWLHFNGIVDLFQSDFVALTPANPETWTTPVLTVAVGSSPTPDKGYIENYKRLCKYIQDNVVMYRLLSGSGVEAQYDWVTIDQVMFKYCSKSEAGAPFQLLRGRA